MIDAEIENEGHLKVGSYFWEGRNIEFVLIDKPSSHSTFYKPPHKYKEYKYEEIPHTYRKPVIERVPTCMTNEFPESCGRCV